MSGTKRRATCEHGKIECKAYRETRLAEKSALKRDRKEFAEKETAFRLWRYLGEYK